MSTISTVFGPYKHNEMLDNKAKALIGSSCTPNKFYVSISNQIMFKNEDGENDYKPASPGDYMYAMLEEFDSYEDAKEFVDEIGLDAETGVSSIQIEDHMTGQLFERTLKEKIKVEYVEEEMDFSYMNED